ncbi:MAG TPA: IS1634 family transposase [Phycisphaerae bacterium]|nr:IS1634 family transposase [Phycisphaerae bacterium]
MFLRSHKRRKNGKTHRYFSIVENRRIAGSGPDGKRMAQRTVLYLGEINDSQQAAWRKTLDVFDGTGEQPRQLALFPDDRPIPPDAVNALQIRLSEMKLLRPRRFGDCWLGCWLWQHLELDRFWRKRFQDARGEVPWEKVLQLLAVHRLIAPGSEYRLHRQWFLHSAMDELLGVDFQAAAKDRLYRCLDRLLAHKDDLFRHLRQRWQDLFAAEFDVLLYDLTSTYFEGLCRENPKARHGYSRDGRGDCRQVVIALIVTPQGFPLAYEVLPGNTVDNTTLREFLRKIEARYGKARRIWIMDRGVPCEATLAEMRQAETDYLVGTPRSMLGKLEQSLTDLPWRQARQDVRVKLLAQEGEVFVLAQSQPRRQKEIAMRRRKLRKLWDGLKRLRAHCRDRDRLLERLAVLKHEAGRAARMVEIQTPEPGRPVTEQTFQYRLKRDAYRQARRRDGSYLLRTTLPADDPEKLWEHYMVLVEVEAAFRCLKSDLAIRPVHHQLEQRVEAHIFVAFLGYCLMVTLKNLLRPHAPGLTPRAVLEKLGTIQMVDVQVPTTDGRWLTMPRHTQPEPEHRMILATLGLTLPPQPPPRITAGQVPRPEPAPDPAGV